MAQGCTGLQSFALVCQKNLSSQRYPLCTSTRSLSPTSPIFQSLSPSQSHSLVLDPYTCADPRRSGGSTESPSPTGYEPKLIQSDDLEPGSIGLGKNLGTDPYQIPERNLGDHCQNPITEDADETGKVGVEMPHVQSKIHSDHDSAESIADSDLEDGELQKMLASPLYVHGR